MNIHCDPSKRHDFVFLFDVVNGNPNGDPDAGNLPRVDAETNRGIVTDVCIKRKVRDYVHGVLNRPIYIQGETALNDLYSQALEGTGLSKPAKLRLADFPDLKKTLDDESLAFDDWLASVDELDYDPGTTELSYVPEGKTAKAIRQHLLGEEEGELRPELKAPVGTLIGKLVVACKDLKVSRQARSRTKEDMRDRYWDVRMFGAVLTAGTNAGQIRGPMQLTFASSVDPVLPRDIAITRVAITKASDMLRKQTEMGRKGYVPYGLYRLHGFYSPLLGVRANGTEKPAQVVTERDLTEFWEALEKMFEFDRSAARGEMSCRGIYIFTHENPKGDAAAHRLFELVQTQSRGDSAARAFGDYAGKIVTPMEGAVEGYPGVTLTRLPHEPGVL
jgi:CRISPR-associated protein Csd2